MVLEKNPHINWNSSKFIKHFAYQIPMLSGVYAIADVNRILGLPTDIQLLYVGRAKNLRRRFLDHINPWREHNKGLLAKNDVGRFEFWFSEQSIDKIDKFEKHLIREINPSENIIRYGGKKNDHE
jgi:excinuclease UvrABC nuclease subunit